MLCPTSAIPSPPRPRSTMPGPILPPPHPYHFFFFLTIRRPPSSPLFPPPPLSRSSGPLNPGTKPAALKLNTPAGQKVFFDVQERSGADNARWRLIDPAGNFVFNNAFFGSVGT